MPQHWELLPLRGVLTERGEFNTDILTTNFLSVIKDVGVVPYEERESSGNKKSEDMSQYKIIHPGDIVANRMNLIFGSVGLSAHFGCSSTEYYVLKARNAQIDTRFYGLIFKSKAFQRSLVGIGSGILAHRMRIYYEALKKVLLPVPSLTEQQEIITHIEKENERCDALHRSYERQLALLAEYRASLIHECVTGQRHVPDGNLCPHPTTN
jgi:type I restriction enzyme S subunit